MAEGKWVTLDIGGYPRRCPESRLEAVLKHFEDLKNEYIQKGVQAENVNEMYTIRVLRDED